MGDDVALGLSYYVERTRLRELIQWMLVRKKRLNELFLYRVNELHYIFPCSCLRIFIGPYVTHGRVERYRFLPLSRGSSKIAQCEKYFVCHLVYKFNRRPKPITGVWN